MADIDRQHVDFAPLSTIDNSRSLYTRWTMLTPRRIRTDWLMRRTTAVFIPSGPTGGQGGRACRRARGPPPPPRGVGRTVVIGGAEKF